MRVLHEAFLAVLLVAPLRPIPPAAEDAKVPDVPARVSVQPGQFAVVKIAPEVEAIYGYDLAKCPLIKLSSESGDTFYLVNPAAPGQYPVMFRVKGSNRGALTIIDAGTPEPPEPPPPPIDERLRKLLGAAYVRDGGAVTEGNEEARKLLAELYRQAADLVMTADTPQALLDQLRRATAALADDRLAETRTVIAEEVGKVLTLNMGFTDANRKSAADLFRRIAVALDW